MHFILHDDILKFVLLNKKSYIHKFRALFYTIIYSTEQVTHHYIINGQAMIQIWQNQRKLSYKTYMRQ